MNSAHPQIPMMFTVHEAFTFENFMRGDNEAVVALLEKQLDPDGEPMLYLWGAEGVGSSHLLQGACHLAASQNKTAMYLPLDEMSQFEPAVLEGAENVDLICLDHLDAIVGQKDWEEALFHLFNRIKDRDGALLVAASSPPRGLDLSLADLVSRLSSCAVFQVSVLNDTDKLRLLQDRAARKGLELSLEAAQFVLNRGDRQISSLLRLLEELDRESLSAGRKLTIPFIKEIMAW